MLDDDVLLALSALLALAFLVRSVRAAPLRAAGQRGGWVWAAGIVIAIAAALAVLQPDGAGWYGLAAAVLLLVVPARLSQLVVTLTFGQRFALAYRLSQIVYLLHPGAAWRQQVRVLAAQRRLGRDDDAAGRAALARIAAADGVPDTLRLSAQATLLRADRDWAGMAALPPSPMNTTLRLRGLGERGELAAMIDEFVRTEPDRAAGRAPTALNLALDRMLLLAFTGRPQAVAVLLAGPLRAMRADARALWIATATRAGGDDAAGIAQLRAIDPPDDEARRNIAERLAWSPPPLDLSPHARAVVDAVAAQAIATPIPLAGRPWVTIALAAVNIAVFVAETLGGGSTDDDTLYAFGALWPPAVGTGGEYWRLLTAMFLHAGVAHILFNMLALTVIGPQLERRIGHWRYALLYFGAGLLSMGAVTGLALTGIAEPSLLVGASGAIMGEIGALAGLALRAPRSDRAAARGALRSALSIIVMQACFDMLVPQVSFAAHASGALAGCLIVLLLPLPHAARAAGGYR